MTLPKVVKLKAWLALFLSLTLLGACAPVTVSQTKAKTLYISGNIEVPASLAEVPLQNCQADISAYQRTLKPKAKAYQQTVFCFESRKDQNVLMNQFERNAAAVGYYTLSKLSFEEQGTLRLGAVENGELVLLNTDYRPSAGRVYVTAIHLAP